MSDTNNGYGELRLAFRDREIPTLFTVSYTLATMSDPGGTANSFGCAGTLAHTTVDDNTFDVASVCGSGHLAIARFASQPAAGRVDVDMPSEVGPGVSGTYKVSVSVSRNAVVMVVDNTHGSMKTLTWPPVGNRTAYIGLAMVWHDAGAQATFSNFHYSGA